METLVNIRDVHKTFTRGDEKIDVLQGLSVGIAKGEFLALMGPSGSGKSTLLNIIGGLDRPTSGAVEVGGVRRENVELPLLLTGLSGAERRKNVATALAVVGLADRMKHYPRQLSGGQEQRVGIARAIVNKPPLLLADEPTGNLDPQLSMDIMRLFEEFNRFGVSVLIATHDLGLIARMRYRTLTLKAGRMYSQEQEES